MRVSLPVQALLLKQRVQRNVTHCASLLSLGLLALLTLLAVLRYAAAPSHTLPQEQPHLATPPAPVRLGDLNGHSRLDDILGAQGYAQ